MTTKYSQFDNAEAAMTPTHQQQTHHDVPMVSVGGYGQSNTMIHIQQPQYEVEERFTWCHFVMSIITFFLGGLCCCNPAVWVFSILGMVYSSNAYGSHGEKAWRKARHQNHTAKVFWILSLVLTIITVVIGIIAIIVAVQMLKKVANETTGEINQLTNNIYNQNLNKYGGMN